MDTFYRLNGRTYVMEYADEDEEQVECDETDDEAYNDVRTGQADSINAQRYRRQHEQE